MRKVTRRMVEGIRTMAEASEERAYIDAQLARDPADRPLATAELIERRRLNRAKATVRVLRGER